MNNVIQFIFEKLALAGVWAMDHRGKSGSRETRKETVALNHYGKNRVFKITLGFKSLATPLCLLCDLGQII